VAADRVCPSDELQRCDPPVGQAGTPSCLQGTEPSMFIIYRNQAAMTPLKDTWEQADAPLRDAILKASRLIDLELQQDPLERGEARDGQTRILFQAPLGVLYEVDEAKQLVRILRTWAYRTAADRQDFRD
jgi:hypothetical protein